MSVFNQLVEELEQKFPEDWWILSRRETERLLPDAFPAVQVYETALGRLDEQSWLVLSEKAHQAFSEPRRERGKHQFFNLLNEALAYEHLVMHGFVNVRLLRAASKTKTPDISYESNGVVHYCEVKTIGVSSEEMVRAASGEVFDCSIYYELNQQFLGKLGSAIQAAMAQIHAVSKAGLVYLIVHFDDFTLDYYDTYQRQIAEFLESEFQNHEVLVRTGISAARYIQRGGC